MNRYIVLTGKEEIKLEIMASRFQITESGCLVFWVAAECIASLSSGNWIKVFKQ